MFLLHLNELWLLLLLRYTLTSCVCLLIRLFRLLHDLRDKIELLTRQTFIAIAAAADGCGHQFSTGR